VPLLFASHLAAGRFVEFRVVKDEDAPWENAP
jgi:hypothetical protein